VILVVSKLKRVVCIYVSNYSLSCLLFVLIIIREDTKGWRKRRYYQATY